MTGALPRAALLAAADGAGFDRAGIVDPAALARWSGGVVARGPSWMQRAWVASADSWADTHTALTCALSCARVEPDDLSEPGDPHALIAPFARRNYYAAAARMMRELLLRLDAGETVSPRTARVFVNSPIPEKPFLAASGVGCYGKNGLTIIPGLGSLFIIAGCILPFPVDAPALDEQAPQAPRAPGDAGGFRPCGACTLCMEACPVGAIVEPGIVDPEVCLQGLAERPILLSPSVMGKWGRRLYGCQDCQAACPHNAGLEPAAHACPGEVGPSVSIRRVLALGTNGVRGMFRGSPMGMRRIHPAALIRNALIAAGNSGERPLRVLLEGFLGPADPVLRETARWALGRLG